MAKTWKSSTAATAVDAPSMGGGRTSFFNEGVTEIYCSEKIQVKGRILPALHYPIADSDPKAFAASVDPYRVPTAEFIEASSKLKTSITEAKVRVAKIKDDTEREAEQVKLDVLEQELATLRTTGNSYTWNPWFQYVYGYKNWGNEGINFLSPRTLCLVAGMAFNDPDAQCPMQDLWITAKSSKDPEWKKCVKEKDEDTNNRFKCALGPASTIALLNFLNNTKEGKTMQGILPLSKSGLGMLLEALDVATPASMRKPHDAAWPQFLAGDITHPVTGLFVFSEIEPLQRGTGNSSAPSRGSKAATLKFSTDKQNLKNYKTWPVNQEVLSKRFSLRSPEVLHIMDYQEIVDLVIAQNALPMDLIRTACGDKANIPMGQRPSTTRRVDRPAPTEPVHERPAPVAGISAAPDDDTPPDAHDEEEPPQSSDEEPPQAADEEAPPDETPVDDRLFWARYNKQTFGDKTPDQVEELWLQHPDLMLTLKGLPKDHPDRVWKSPEAYGFTAPGELVDDAASAPPDDESAGNGSLTPAEAAELKALEARVEAKEIPTEYGNPDFKRFIDLSTKKGS